MKLSRILTLFSLGSSLVYVVTYLLMAEAAVERYAMESRVVPHYRYGGEVAKQIYAPLHHLDTCVRTKYWQAQ
jgi:hypothetical protein